MGPDDKALFDWAEYSCSRFYTEPSAELSEADQWREHVFVAPIIMGGSGR